LGQAARKKKTNEVPERYTTVNGATKGNTVKQFVGERKKGVQSQWAIKTPATGYDNKKKKRGPG